LDSKPHRRASLGSEPKVSPESDTDSMAEYGDGDTGRFFILKLTTHFLTQRH